MRGRAQGTLSAFLPLCLPTRWACEGRASRRHRRNGFTLMEVLVAIAITSMLLLAIISSLVFSLRSQALQEQRAAAVLAAEQELEMARSRVFQDLTPLTRTVTIDDNRTSTTSDDLTGTLILALRRMDGTLLSVGQKPTTTDRLIAEVTVTWSGKGNLQSKQMHETLMKILVP